MLHFRNKISKYRFIWFIQWQWIPKITTSNLKFCPLALATSFQHILRPHSHFRVNTWHRAGPEARVLTADPDIVTIANHITLSGGAMNGNWRGSALGYLPKAISERLMPAFGAWKDKSFNFCHKQRRVKQRDGSTLTVWAMLRRHIHSQVNESRDAADNPGLLLITL